MEWCSELGAKVRPESGSQALGSMTVAWQRTALQGFFCMELDTVYPRYTLADEQEFSASSSSVCMPNTALAAWAQALAPLSQLSSLELNSCRRLSEEGAVRALALLTALTSLQAYRCVGGCNEAAGLHVSGASCCADLVQGRPLCMCAYTSECKLARRWVGPRRE
jgi:hypothetical protein